MKHALIIAHPNPSGFTSTVARVYRDSIVARGHAALVRDLYRMNFDPVLKATEIPGHPEFAPDRDVVAEREALQGADVFAFFYPFWLNAPPAIMKGYMERVFGFGFAYGRALEGNTPLLAQRKMISFSSSGAPHEWLKTTGNWDAIRTLTDEHFANVCGLRIVEHVHFGRIVPGMRADVIERHLETVRSTVTRNF